MLTEVRRRRERRQRIQFVLAAACIVVIIGFTVRFIPRQDIPTSIKTNRLVVHSQPLKAGMTVATQPGFVTVVKSSDSSVVLVEAMPAAKLFEFIGDDQPLALLGSRPAALIHHGVSDAEPVFLNPADNNGFQVP